MEIVGLTPSQSTQSIELLVPGEELTTRPSLGSTHDSGRDGIVGNVEIKQSPDCGAHQRCRAAFHTWEETKVLRKNENQSRYMAHKV